MLLSGTAPFNGSTPQEIMGNVRKGQWSFKAAIWKSISADGKDFISKLLTYDPVARPSAQEILGHAWI